MQDHNDDLRQHMTDDDFYFSAFEQSPIRIPPTQAELNILDHWDHNLLPSGPLGETETDVISVLARYNRISLDNLTEFPLTPETQEKLTRLFNFIYSPDIENAIPGLMANLLMHVFFYDYFNPRSFDDYPPNTAEIPF